MVRIPGTGLTSQSACDCRYALLRIKPHARPHPHSQTRSFATQNALATCPPLKRVQQRLLCERTLSRGQQRFAADVSNARHQAAEETHQYEFSIKPKQVERSGRSQIRQSLRAWSERHEKATLQDLPSELPSEGRLVRLPNALFIGAGQTLDDVDEEDSPEAPDLDRQDDEIDNHSLYRGGHIMGPGTLISHKSLLVRRQDVIYLGDIGTQSLMVLGNGKWAAEKLIQKRVAISSYRHYPIQDFLTSEEVASLRQCMPRQDVVRALELGTTPQPVNVSGTVPEHVFAPILAKFQNFVDEKERFLRDHREQLRQMYDKLAFDDKWRAITIKDLPRLVLGIELDALSDAAKKTFVEYACTFNPLFAPVQTAEAITFIIGPKSLNDDVTSVQEWARLYQEAAASAALGKDVSGLLKTNPLASFVDKARRMITKSRKMRSPTNMGALGPALGSNDLVPPQKASSGEELTPDDQKVVRYLWEIAIRRPLSSLPRSYGSLVVRAIGAYPNMELDPKTFRMLLQEMGCIDPWTFTEDFNLPLFGTKASWASDQLWLTAVDSIAGVTDKQKGATTFPDSVVDLRKDWKDEKVICIDRSSTRNIEDGISVEAASELDGGHWLHVHFAHPSAHLKVDHPVVQAARKRGASYYSHIQGTKIQQLVPEQVIRQFSLQNNSPALTVSTLLTPDGKVHDIKVVPGILRHVTRLDRGAVSKILESDMDADDDAILVVGKATELSTLLAESPGQRGDEAAKRELDMAFEHRPQLELIKSLLTARRLQRKQEVRTPARFRRLGIRASTQIVLPEAYRKDREFESYHWRGNPTIVVRGNRVVPSSDTTDEYRADDIVASSVRLAAESLGRWFSDRNIPAVFLGNDTPTAYTVEQLNDLIPRTEITAPIFTRTTFPRPLIGQNMKQYASCSSPLRKYSDLMAQFQVDSYLRAEANGSIAMRSTIEDDTVLAFSKADVEDYLAVDVSAGDSLEDFTRESTQFWLFQALFRAFHFKEATLPDILEVLVQTPTRRNAFGHVEATGGLLVPWGARVDLDASPQGYEKTAQVGDFLPVQRPPDNSFVMQLFLTAQKTLAGLCRLRLNGRYDDQQNTGHTELCPQFEFARRCRQMQT